MLKQAEIDVLGLELRNGGVDEIYGIDIAFQENGLNNGNVDQTVEIVIQKMIKMSMIMVGYMDLTKGKIIFVSPKVNNTINKRLAYLIKEMNDLYKSMKLEFEFNLFTNESFQNQVLNPVIERANTAADTSELFMRNVQMNNLFKETAANIKGTEYPKERNVLTYRNGSRNHRTKVSTELLMKENKVAYYLSRFEHTPLFPQYNQTQAFEVISKILGVKLTTLRLKRDTYDPFCNNLKKRGRKRKGWWQNNNSSDDMQRIYDRYLHMSEEEIEREIKEILDIKVEN